MHGNSAYDKLNRFRLRGMDAIGMECDGDRDGMALVQHIERVIQGKGWRPLKVSVSG